MKKIEYTNRQLVNDYWRVKEEDFKFIPPSTRQKTFYEKTKKAIMYCPKSIPQFYYNHNGSLTKLDIKGISHNATKIL